MRVLTYCVTAAPGAAQTLRRGFTGHITVAFFFVLYTRPKYLGITGSLVPYLYILGINRKGTYYPKRLIICLKRRGYLLTY